MTQEEAKFILEKSRQDTICYQDKLRIEEIMKAEIEYLEWLKLFQPKPQN